MRPAWFTDFYAKKIGRDSSIADGLPLERMIAMMDEAGIERAMLVATKTGRLGLPGSWHLPYDTVAAAVRAFPDRFCALAGIDPTEGMKGVRELERAVKDLGFIGAHMYPHWFELAPDHARWYPFYAKCVELDVPVQVQVGQSLIYASDQPLRSVGRPIYLDTLARDFPKMKIIAAHPGWPWEQELIGVVTHKKNLFVDTSGYLAEQLPELFQKAIGGRLQPLMSHLIESGKLTHEDIKQAERMLEEFSRKEKEKTR